MNDDKLLWEPKNPVNQFVFSSLSKAQPPADLDILEEAVKDYIAIASQSDNGLGNRGKKDSYNFETDIDTTVFTILCEASALVLSGQLDKLRELENE